MAIVLLGLISACLSKFIAPRNWGVFLVVAMSILGVVLGVAAYDVPVRIGTFSHPVFGTSLFSCDQLSSWFLIIVCGIFAVGAFYGRGYLSHYKTTRIQEVLHWGMTLVTLAGLVILLTTNNLIVFLLGWEMMAIGSFFAVIFEYDHMQVVKAGLNYFIQSHIAVLLITIVFVWSMTVSGSATFDGLRSFFSSSSSTTQIVAMSLLIAGFGFKAGFVPFHSWLPLAHPAAPSHISALMSGVIVKAGIYGIVRFGSMLTGADAQLPIGVTLLAIGVISGLYGILNAAEHRDFKRMLAYCTIENVGIIAMGLGVGFIGLGVSNSILAVIGFGGAMLHTLNHAIFKALLFFGAGNIYVSIHSRNMEELGGLIKKMPRTAVVFLIGSLAIGALPPFGGFVSELLIYNGFLRGFRLESIPVSTLMAISGCALAVIGGVSMLAFTKAFGIIFLGTPRKELAHEPHEVQNSMLWPAYILVALTLCVIFFPAFLVSHLFSVSLSLFRVEASPIDIVALNDTVKMTQYVGYAMFGLLIGILIFLAIRQYFAMRRPTSVGATWGCGYKRPIAGIQYSSKSFAKTLVDMCHGLLPSSERFTPITNEEVFPADRGHMSVDFDLVDEQVVSPATHSLLHGLEHFQFIQNGMLQRYIVYGLGYVVLLIISVVIFG